MLIMETKGERSQTHLKSLERLIGGGVDGKDHTSLTVAGKGHQSSLQREDGEHILTLPVCNRTTKENWH